MQLKAKKARKIHKIPIFILFWFCETKCYVLSKNVNFVGVSVYNILLRLFIGVVLELVAV